jgi:hypothetical protein
MDIIHDLARALATQMAEEDYAAEQAREEKTSVLSANAPVRLAAANAAIRRGGAKFSASDQGIGNRDLDLALVLVPAAVDLHAPIFSPVLAEPTAQRLCALNRVHCTHCSFIGAHGRSPLPVQRAYDQTAGDQLWAREASRPI